MNVSLISAHTWRRSIKPVFRDIIRGTIRDTMNMWHYTWHHMCVLHEYECQLNPGSYLEEKQVSISWHWHSLSSPTYHWLIWEWSWHPFPVWGKCLIVWGAGGQCLQPYYVGCPPPLGNVYCKVECNEKFPCPANSPLEMLRWTDQPHNIDNMHCLIHT